MLYPFLPRYFRARVQQWVSNTCIRLISYIYFETTLLLRIYHVLIYLWKILGLYHRQRIYGIISKITYIKSDWFNWHLPDSWHLPQRPSQNFLRHHKEVWKKNLSYWFNFPKCTGREGLKPFQLYFPVLTLLRTNYKFCELLCRSLQTRISFWSVFPRIRTKYGEILRISPYSVRMREKYGPEITPYLSTFHAVTKK